MEILRGAVDRTDWKAYLLPLLFFKRICDVWNEEAEEAAAAFKAALLETRAAEDLAARGADNWRVAEMT